MDEHFKEEYGQEEKDNNKLNKDSKQMVKKCKPNFFEKVKSGLNRLLNKDQQIDALPEAYNNKTKNYVEDHMNLEKCTEDIENDFKLPPLIRLNNSKNPNSVVIVLAPGTTIVVPIE